MFRSGPSGRRAGLLGGPDLWEIVGDYKRAQDAGAEPLRTICETTPVDEDQIMLALAYYRAYPEEIDDRLRADDEAHARLAGVVGGDDTPA